MLKMLMWVKEEQDPQCSPPSTQELAGTKTRRNHPLRIDLLYIVRHEVGDSDRVCAVNLGSCLLLIGVGTVILH